MDDFISSFDMKKYSISHFYDWFEKHFVKYKEKGIKNNL